MRSLIQDLKDSAGKFDHQKFYRCILNIMCVVAALKFYISIAAFFILGELPYSYIWIAINLIFAVVIDWRITLFCVLPVILFLAVMKIIATKNVAGAILLGSGLISASLVLVALKR